MAEIVLDLVMDNAKAASSLKEMRSSLRELNSAILQVPQGSDEWHKLVEQAGAIKNELNDANAAMKTMSGDGIEGLNSGLAGTKSALAGLNFKFASQQLGLMTASIKKMDLATLNTGLKSVTSSIVAMGKAILTNPIFLLAGVLIGLATLFWKLRDAGGVVTKMFEGMKRVLDVVVNTMKKLSDAIGLTNFKLKEQKEAAEELAAQEAKAAQERLETIEQLKKADEDYEYSKLKAEEKFKKSIDEQTKGLKELENQYKQVKRAVDSGANDSFVQRKKELEEEIALREKLRQNTKEQLQELINLEKTAANEKAKNLEKQKAEEKLARELSKHNSENLAQQTLINLAKGEILKNDKQIEDTIQRAMLNEKQLLIIKQAEEQILKNNIKFDLERLGYQDKSVQNVYEELKVKQQLSESEVQALHKISEFRLNTFTLESKLEDDIQSKRKENMDILDEGWEKMVENYTKRDEMEIEHLELLKQKNIIEWGSIEKTSQLIEQQAQHRKQMVTIPQVFELQALNILLESKKISEEEYLDKKLKMEEESAAKIVIINKRASDEIADARMAALGKINEYMSQTFQFESQLRENKASEIERELVLELNKLDTQLMSQEAYDVEVNKLKGEAFKQEEELRRKTFVAEKASRLAGSIMQGAQAVVAALTLPPPVGTVMAVVNGAIAAAQVAAIAKQKYVPTLNSASPNFKPNISTPSSGGSIEPNMNAMFGTGSSGSRAEVTPFDPKKDNIQRVVVYESDITQSQRRNSKAQETAVI